jgi:hypothetical protein
MKAGKWERALGYLLEAETWPEHLGWGEPYFPDNRLTRFFSAYCYEMLRDKANSGKSFEYIRQYKNPDDRTSLMGNRMSAKIDEGNRDFRIITEDLIHNHGNDRDVELLKSFLAIL